MTAPNGTARWGNLAAVAGVGLTMLGAIFFLYQTATSAAKDVEALKARVDAIELTANLNATDIKVIRSDLREVETQFRASDQVRNLTHANDLRVQAMLWKKAFGADFPLDNAYYPEIAREPPN